MQELITSLRSSPHFKKYTSYAVDLTGADSIKPTVTVNGVVVAGAPCRRIRATTAGTITVKCASNGALIVLDFLDGESQDIIATELTSVSGPTAVTVYW